MNDKPVETFSLYQLRKLLKREGEDVRMTLQRGEKTFDARFRLREFRTFLPEPADDVPAEK